MNIEQRITAFHFMTIFSQYKKRIFSSFFLLYFIVYAISPLTYTFSENRSGEDFLTSEAAHSGIRGVNLLVWEVLREKTRPREKTAEDHASDSILIKKKRALLPENGTAALLLFSIASLPKHSSLLPGKDVARLVGDNIFSGVREGFSSLYAGHSPPQG